MRFDNYIVEEKDKVKIVILTSHTEKGSDEDVFYVVDRIIEECKKNNQECYTLFSEDSRVETDKNGIARIYSLDYPDGVELDKTNTVVFARGNFIRTRACLDILSQIEQLGIFCVNTRLTVEQCAEKFRTTTALVNAGIPTPKTAIISNVDGIKIGFEVIGEKFPVILKTMTGSKGIGVSIAGDWATLKSVLQTIWKIDPEEEMLIQEYIEADYDIRTHVLGNEVIAAMKRYKIKDDFRSNFSLGGEIEEIELTDEQKDLAIRANAAVGGVWTAVDLMDGMVIEINSSPGTEGIEKATKESVVGMVLDYINDKSNWTKKTKEVGFAEKIKVIGIGDMVAKMDTGNSNYCVIHADDWDIDGDEVKWTHHGKEFTHEIESFKEVLTGIIDKHEHKRPVIRLDVEFDGELFKDIRFTLADREGPLGDALMNRAFLRRANLVVNPWKRCELKIDEAKNPVKKTAAVVSPNTQTKKVDTKKKPEAKKKPVATKKADTPKLSKKPDQKTIDWWNSHSKESQQAHITAHKDGPVAQLVKAGILKLGQKYGGGQAVRKEVDAEPKPKSKLAGKLGEPKEKEPLKKPVSVDALMGKSIEISPAIKKSSEKILTNVEDELEKEFHDGKSKKGSFGEIATKTAIQYGLQAIEHGEKDVDKVADMVHKGFSAAVMAHKAHGDKKEIRYKIAATPYEKLPTKYKDRIVAIAKHLLKPEKKATTEKPTAEKPLKTVNLKADKNWNKTFNSNNEKFMTDTKHKDMFVEKKDIYKVPSYIKGSDKFNKRDVDLFERLLNSKNVGKFSNIMDFSEGDKCGAGTIQSQFGELATEIMISLDDKSADRFYKEAIEHLDRVRGGKTLTEKDNIDRNFAGTRSWINAAYKTRNAMKIAVDEMYPGKNIEDVLDSVSWDRPDTVEAMGFDYSKKEPSTDVFVKFKDPKTKKEHMMELSLKKSFLANLYNGGLADQQKLWGDNIPEDLKIKNWQKKSDEIYSENNTKNFKDSMTSYITKNIKDVNDNFIKEVFKKYKATDFIKNNRPDITGLVDDITNLNKGSQRTKRKLHMLFQVEQDKDGNKNARKFLEKVATHSNDYVKNVVHLVKNNSKIKEAVLSSLKENIPLKGIIEGKETLFAGQYPLTQNVLKDVFGTNNWNKIVENIDIETKGREHYLSYKVDAGEPIKVADINIREDGVGYGQVIKFEMKFTPEGKSDSLAYKIKEKTGGLNKIKESKEIETPDDSEDDDDFDLNKYLEENPIEHNEKLQKYFLGEK